ncbi:MAG: hypothetical protein AAGJ83_07500, partial [Planctomycetota bacterium]
SNSDDFADDATVQFDRLRAGVADGDVVSIDFTHILSPVLQGNEPGSEAALVDELRTDSVQEVVDRARRVADRAEVVDEPKSDTGIDTLVRRQIAAGIKDGGY